jgi:hypothetical protein
LTTGGIVSNRLGDHATAKNRFEAALKVAERCGDREGGRRALVSFFEEMSNYLDKEELRLLLSRLEKLSSVTEPSVLIKRVEATIPQIKAMLDR